jgi:hypothetical protein
VDLTDVHRFDETGGGTWRVSLAFRMFGALVVAWFLVEQEADLLGPGEFDERFVEVLPIGLLDDQLLPGGPPDTVCSIEV